MRKGINNHETEPSDEDQYKELGGAVELRVGISSNNGHLNAIATE